MFEPDDVIWAEGMNCTEIFHGASGEEIGWHVDSFFVLNGKVVVKQGQLKTVQGFCMQVVKFFWVVCGLCTYKTNFLPLR